MMPAFLLTLLANPARLACLLLSVALAGSGALAWTRGKDVAVLTAQKAALQTAYAAAGKTITEQNAAVATLKAASDAQAAATEHAAKEAARALGAAQARIEALKRAKVPRDCKGAVDWLGQRVFGGAK